jgi:hypothetical protein
MNDSEILRKIVREEYADKKKLGELISGILVHSKTKVSLWLNRKYNGDTKTLERDIARFIKARQINRHDERILLDIRHLLNRADDPQAIIARLATDVENIDG